MIEIFGMAALFFFVLLGHSIVAGILYLIYKPIRKKLYERNMLSQTWNCKIMKLAIFVIIVSSSHSTWTSVYPPDSFYESEFEYNTGLDFPTTGEIIRKDSWYPDMHGDYWSAAVMTVSKQEFEELKEQLFNSPKFEIDDYKFGIGATADFEELVKGFPEDNYSLTLNLKKGEYFKVAFSKDGKTIVFEKASS